MSSSISIAPIKCPKLFPKISMQNISMIKMCQSYTPTELLLLVKYKIDTSVFCENGFGRARREFRLGALDEFFFLKQTLE